MDSQSGESRAFIESRARKHDKHTNATSDIRKSGTSTRERRVVSKLSDERLARKRTADRHAQRVLRDKTRRHIEELEQKIQQLENTSKIDHALRVAERKTVELEEELRLTRDAVYNLTNSQGMMAFGPSQVEAYPVSSKIQFTSTTKFDEEDFSVPEAFDSQELPSIQFVTDASAPRPSNRLAPHTNSRAIPIRNPRIPRGAVPVTSLAPKSPKVKNKSSESRSLTRSTYIFTSATVRQPSINPWELPLRIEAPKSPIDFLLSGIIEQQKGIAAEGASQALVAGPKFPNLNVLLLPEYSHLVHPVARVLTDLLKRITYRTFLDKLGAFLVMYPVYQWQIVNTYETYAALPSYSVPLLAQRTFPHPVWLCALGWPKLREHCINNQEEYTTEEFQYTFVQSLNVNWPHGIEAALRRVEGGITVTREFWEHTRVLDNWSLNDPFQSRYPELEEYCRFTKHS